MFATLSLKRGNWGQALRIWGLGRSSDDHWKELFAYDRDPIEISPSPLLLSLTSSLQLLADRQS